MKKFYHMKALPLITACILLICSFGAGMVTAAVPNPADSITANWTLAQKTANIKGLVAEEYGTLLNAFDGNVNNGWAINSSQNGLPWITIDLQKLYRINSFAIVGAQDSTVKRIKDCRIQVSATGAAGTYHDVVKVIDNSNRYMTRTCDFIGRYLKIQVDTAAQETTEVFAVFGEVMFFGVEAPVGAQPTLNPTFISLPKTFDQYTVPVKNIVKDLENDDIDNWGQQGWNGGALNWAVNKVNEGVGGSKCYKASFNEAGVVSSPNFRLAMQGWDMSHMSNFDYVYVDVCSNIYSEIYFEQTYDNNTASRDTGRVGISSTNGQWQTIKIARSQFNTDWLDNDFFRIANPDYSWNRMNYLKFTISFDNGNNQDRYFKVDNFKFEWLDSTIKVVDMNYFNKVTGYSVNDTGLTTDGVNVICQIKSKEAVAKDVTFVSGLYDKATNKLLSIDAQKQTLAPTETKEYRATVNPPDSNFSKYVIRSFVWEGGNNMPITFIKTFE